MEIVEEAVEAAKKSPLPTGWITANHRRRCVEGTDEVEEKPDMIILDPPRDGIHPKALPKIIAYGVEHIVYTPASPPAS